MSYYDNEYALKGWSDYAAGLPYAEAYDRWSEKSQRNYENGRMRAANYKLSGARLTRRHASFNSYRAATAAVGPAFFNANAPESSIPKMQRSGQRQR